MVQEQAKREVNLKELFLTPKFLRPLNIACLVFDNIIKKPEATFENFSIYTAGVLPDSFGNDFYEELVKERYLKRHIAEDWARYILLAFVEEAKNQQAFISDIGISDEDVDVLGDYLTEEGCIEDQDAVYGILNSIYQAT